jgi:hypothetical protein
VRAFLVGRAHLILPAYGTYTGGLEAAANPLRALVPQGYAIACTPALPLVPLPVQRDVSTVKKASIAASRRS